MPTERTDRYRQHLNYSIGEPTLWLVYIFENIMAGMTGEDGQPIENRIVVSGYNLDSPKFNQKRDPVVVIQEVNKRQWLKPMLTGKTSTSITTTQRLQFGINATGDQGRIYNLWLYHYYTGTPQFLQWNREFCENYNLAAPEFGADDDIGIINSDAYGAGQSWFINFLHTVDYSSSTRRIDTVTLADDVIVAEYRS